MNVGELKAALDEYGDHIRVGIESEDGLLWDPSQPSTETHEGVLVVVIGCLEEMVEDESEE